MLDDIKLPLVSPDPVDDPLAQLRTSVPQVFSEGRAGSDRLGAVLDKHAGEGPERYGLGWAGKPDAFRNLRSPSVGTLLPMPKESVNWDGTENLIIEGDNLEVLKLLQKPYHGKVKLIYIDPPYNTGNAFIHPDNCHDRPKDYVRCPGQVNDEGVKHSIPTGENGRFPSQWLSMIYPRLFLARNLLREDGVIFVSVDNNEVHNLRLLMNDVFGEANFLACFIRKRRKPAGMRDTAVSPGHEYVVAFTRSIEIVERIGRTLAESTSLIKSLLSFSTRSKENDIVLDFFASSGATAHAVLELNAGDAGNRKFVLVLLPEKLGSPTDSTIASITRKRMRRILAQLGKDDDGNLVFENTTKPDYGFRAFKLSSSNFKIRDAEQTPDAPEKPAAQLKFYADHIEYTRSEQDLLYELILKSGLPLSSKVSKMDIAGTTVWSVNNNNLLIYLNKSVFHEMLRGMIARKPEQMLCLDAAFGGDDALKTNILLEAKSHGIVFRTV